MKDNSDNIYDWIGKIIQTCTHDFHFEAVDNLIDLYFEFCKDENKTLELKIQRQQKWNDIHDILT
jgi:hypothetical protein